MEMYNNLDDWNKFIVANYKEKDAQKALMVYISNLYEKKTIVILTFEHICRLIGVDVHILSKIIHNQTYFYHTFTIPKRNGKLREICAPSAVLLNCQKWIYQNLLKAIPVHKNCYGFREGFSIRNNAIEHLDTKFLLKLDLKDFFPSISIKRVIAIFINLGYSPQVSYCLAAICTLENKLPQGAPTSPQISNIIAKRLDYRLDGFAKKFNLNYSRYADDLTFSGEKLPITLVDYIEKIIVDEGFVLNKSKTKLLSPTKRKIVTGVSISSNKPTIPKAKKRFIRQEIHYILNYGVENHLVKRNINDPIYIERLLGYLFFWKSIEPENQFIINSINSISKKRDEFNEKYADLKCDLEYITFQTIEINPMI